MGRGNKKFRHVMNEILEANIVGIKQEMEGVAPHVFSEEFEKNIEEAMQVKRSGKGIAKSRFKALRYVAAAFLAACFLGVFLFADAEKMLASVGLIDILEWSDTNFKFEAERTEAVKTTEMCNIGYIPEGFVLEYNSALTFRTECKYQNEHGEYFILSANWGGGSYLVDNENVVIDTCVSETGIEYMYIFKPEEKVNTVYWYGKDGALYHLIGNVQKEEIIKIMESIS